MNLATLWAQSDGLGRGVMLLLLAMSVLTWMVIVYKAWLLARARRSIEGGLAGYWRAADSAGAEQALQQADRLHLLWPLHGALGALPEQPGVRSGTDGVQAPSAARQAHLTRLLRDGLQQSTRQLQWGQILLATVGSTAPFVGLLGTVWGIYHALTGLTGGGAISIDQVAGPVGEALIMTAFGLMVAIPAVVAYNIFGRLIGALVERLDGFAHDLLALHGGSGSQAA
ncbi:MotA/TolQ/ExbB proton channel family protein [Brachymonas denitrificans]|mgnify:CR=1 FL=1|uniref:Biopolymer transport protein ExbB n=1 Tax=Brachymonas denitrificans DSM 15123 TaxID=1121117 RepID=A0A1H8KQL4_9BURK|nr:MotA/TolQ/ExbB proton channel family protein [Brachymonas denitrificans]SEN95192.1 biopolymer transport protein ExbB [Brachymonas denitrificans DSM 15123]